ncbi:CHAT domain-containing protein [Gammaproteobacteria bacterium]|nr:CHAT domain-containing protein [Gammaproteobacteria bacterium]
MNYKLIIILSLSLVTSNSYGNQSDYAEKVNKANQAYFSGEIISSIQNLQELYGSYANTDLYKEKRIILIHLLENCIGAWDYSCQMQFVPELQKTWSEEKETLPKSNTYDVLFHETENEVTYYVGKLIDAYTKPKEKFGMGREDWLHAYYENSEEVPASTALYIKRQLLAASMYNRLELPAKARLSIDKAISMLVSVNIQGPIFNSIALALTDIISKLTVLDPQMAYAIYQVAGKFILNSTPTNSLGHFMFRQVEAQVLQFFGDYKGAIQAIDSSLASLENIDLNKHSKDYYLAHSQGHKMFLCTLSFNYDCANRALENENLTKRLNKALTDGEIKDQITFSYLAAKSLLFRVTDRSISPEETKLLKQDITFMEPVEDSERFDLYRRAALMMSSHYVRDKSKSIELAKHTIEYANKLFTKQYNTFPLVDASDKVVIFVALKSLLHNVGVEDLALNKYVLQLIELWNRKITQSDTESLLAISSAKDPNLRKEIQTLIRLDNKKGKLYLKDLNEQIELLNVYRKNSRNSNFSATTSSEYDYSKRSKHIEFAERISYYEKQINADEMLKNVNRLPSAKDLQEILSEDEAFITKFRTADTFRMVCFTKNSVHLSDTLFDFKKRYFDYKLINASLEGTHQPSDQLDSQFPVESSIRFYDVLIRPIEKCLVNKKHIIWVPDGGTRAHPIPISVLLSEKPPANKYGYDLSKAKWLGLKYSISYTLSAKGFIASRKINQYTSTSGKYLGVGNPSYDKAADTYKQKVTSKLRGAVSPASGLIASLPLLPDTEQEIKTISSFFPDKGSDILIGDNATEISFRRRPLSQYSYISFATHGLLRNEIKGLTEAALALSPGTIEDSFDDGLLMASEISELDLSAKLVVLSACNTANYDYQYMSNEVSGLTSAFSMAGVPAILVTLWPVDSLSSNKIATGLFRNIRNKDIRSSSEALRLSILDFFKGAPSKAHFHPRFWSPFIIYGDGGNVSLVNKSKKLNIKEFLLITEGGGEITAASKGFSDGSYILRGIGNPEKKIYKTIIKSKEKGGGFFKEIDNIGLASGLIVSDAIYIDGYDSKDTECELVAYRCSIMKTSSHNSLLLKFDKNGNEVFRISFPKDDYNTYPISIIEDKNILYALVEEVPVQFLGSGKSNTISIYKVSKQGVILERNTLWKSSQDKRPFTNQSLEIINNKLYFSTSYSNDLPSQNKKNTFRINEFDEIVKCYRKPRSYLFIIDLDTFKLEYKYDISPYEFKNLQYSKLGKLLGIGRVQRGCQINEYSAIVADLTSFIKEKDEHVSIIYKDDSGLSSSAVSFNLTDEVIWVFTNLQRPIGAQNRFNNMWEYNKHIGKPIEGKLQSYDHAFLDGIVLKLDYDGTLLEKYNLSVGVSTVLNTSVIVDENIIFSGMLGSEAATLTIPLQSN